MTYDLKIGYHSLPLVTSSTLFFFCEALRQLGAKRQGGHTPTVCVMKKAFVWRGLMNLFSLYHAFFIVYNSKQNHYKMARWTLQRLVAEFTFKIFVSHSMMKNNYSSRNPVFTIRCVIV